MNSTNITELPSINKKLTCKVGWCKYSYSYDDNYASSSYVTPVASGQNQYDLWRLIPIPLTQSVKDENAVTILRIGLVCFLVSVIIWFSVIRDAVPLLAPVLFGFGVLYFFLGARRSINETTYTLFFGSESGPVLKIPIEGDFEGDREKFIKGLTSAIEGARENAYGKSGL